MVDLLSSLYGSGRLRSSRLADLMAQRPNDVTLAVFGQFAGSESSGAYWKKSPMQNLKNYVTDNVKGHDARKLMAQIAAVEGLYAINDPKAANDAAYAVLAGNRNALRTLPAGSMMNRLF